MKSAWLLSILLLLMVCSTNAQSTLYISPSGSDSNPGTITFPTTLAKAITLVSAGGTIYARGGTYNLSATILIARGNDGSSGALKKIFAFNGEIPILNFSSQTVSTSNRGIVLDALYWHLKGLIIERAGDNGILLSGNNNIIESCVFRSNNDSGLQLSRYNTSFNSISQWPAGNLILNCEAYDNKDPDNEDADGFAAKLTCGNNNVFRNCVAHHNIDDGWDLYTKSDTGPIGAILLENCIAHSNGTLTSGGTSGNGDKNGFKLGGEDIGVNHMVRRCIAFNNGKHGFTYNRNLGTIEMTNNTAFGNTERNFNFDGGTSIFKNNLSFYTSSHTNDKFIGTASGATNAFWVNNASSNFSVTAGDFVTLTPGSNTSPTSNGFLNLASGSDLINAGVASSGISYNGSAPDIGAVESGGTTPSTYTLTVASSPSNGGVVTRSPNSTAYAAGTVVTLTAQPASGYVFSGWSGAASGNANPITVTMNSNLTITATFTTTNNPGAINLNATAGDAQVSLSWTVANVTLTGQEVYRDTDSDPTGRVRIATPSTTARAYTDMTAVNGTTYFYWIKGVDATTTYNSNVAQATPQGQGTGATIRLEESATPTSGYCSAEGSRQSSYAGANNGYYINISNSTAKGINWRVSSAGGTCTLVWRYANAGSSSSTTAKVLVNGATAVASVSFPKTTSWTTWVTTSATVVLTSGINTIRLETTSGNEFANIDWMEVTGNSLSAASCGNARPATDEFSTENEMVVYPNPSEGNFYLSFDLQSPGNVDIVTMNLLGQRLQSDRKYFAHAGRHAVNFDLSACKGIHLIVINDGFTKRVTKVFLK
ncbi:InlB B-repeat-containing protein [Pseudochryseolinea flava]|uniref:InlB B-repeat-containing protein n=1 Tax=Pseudochryseolinea flava TaxID=2059302 RepID=UPI001402637A|nr:right-handed parallel beta-helix repeat-containing protein [Pseudochryseolinea flava]